MKKKCALVAIVLVAAAVLSGCMTVFSNITEVDVAPYPNRVHNLRYVDYAGPLSALSFLDGFDSITADKEDGREIAEDVLKPELLVPDEPEQGYYSFTYYAHYSEGLLKYIHRSIITVPFILVGVPITSYDVHLYANLFIFDSDGNLVEHITGSAYKYKLKGLYYGYSIDTNDLISDACEQIAQKIDKDSDEINKKLEMAGPVSATKDAAAVATIQKKLKSLIVK